MNINNTIPRLQAHTDQLLSCLLGLKEKYAFLQPMLFDEDTVKQFGNGERYRGFEAIKYALFYGCAQDLAKMTLDTDSRSPSIASIIAQLQKHPKLLQELCVRYAEWGYGIPVQGNEYDDDMKEALRQLNARETVERRQKFYGLYVDLVAAWEVFKSKPSTMAFKTIRDRLTAHLELHLGEDGVYRTTDIAKLGLKWQDLGDGVKDVEKLVELSNAIIRCAVFGMEHFDEMLEKAVKEYWVNG